VRAILADSFITSPSCDIVNRLDILGADTLDWTIRSARPTQYALELSAEMVWVHVALTTCTWVAIVAGGGRGAPGAGAAAQRGPRAAADHRRGLSGPYPT
jgi:hypothetical protein